MSGRLNPQTARLRVSGMHRKVASRAQMIHHQLTGPTTASRLECHNLHSRPLRYSSEHERVYRILRAIPVASALRSRVT
jgi:hypothetical protein